MSNTAEDAVLPIFVVGFPRSGTTLVQSLFAAHGQVLALPETHLLTAATAKLGPIKRLGIARMPIEPGHSGIHGRRRPSRRPGRQTALLREFTDAANAAAVQAGCLAWAEKTPAHLHFIGVIERTVPQARFVHVVRGPVRAIASLHRATTEYPNEWGGQRSVETCLRRWIGDVAISARYASEPRHFIVPYEALIADPRSVAERLFARVGLPLDEPALSASLARRAEASRSVIGEGEEWKLRTLAPINAETPDDDSDLLPPATVDRILAASAPWRNWLDNLPPL